MNLRIMGFLSILTLSISVYGQKTDKYLDIPLPAQWTEADSVFHQTLPVEDNWWRTFEDLTLDSLINIAIKQNYSVLTAINRIEMAKANLQIARSGFYPSLAISGGWTKQQTSGNTSSIPQSREHYFEAALGMNWEVDVFGSIRNRAKAQKENFMASEEEYNATMVSLCAQVASDYINLRQLQQELEVVKKNCASQKAVLKITEVRYNTGLVSKLDVLQAKSVYFSTKASIPTLESEIIRYINSLAILLGVYPSDLRFSLEKPGNLPDYMEPISVGIPANLLRRRPDIRAAERQVNAQAALLGASKSDWLPKFFLKGSVGYASKNIKDFANKKSFTYEIAPSFSWTLFNGTQLVNATKLARAQLEETINQFNQTVLTAVQEVDNAMNAYQNSIKQIVALREVLYQGQQTLNLSLELYKQGLTPFQNVLDAQRSLLSYENSLVEAKGNSLLYLIQMYQALGGGWQE